MGSIVKTIGKAIKKVGKILKKIAPVLLVAAAAYVGYGYMTGFQAGGWPQITEWGKSLMGGVSQGQTLSQAANAAVGGATPGAATGLGADAATGLGADVTTGLGATTDVTSSALPGSTPYESMGMGMVDQEAYPDPSILSDMAEGKQGLLSQGIQLNKNLFPYSTPSVEKDTWMQTVVGSLNPVSSAQAGVLPNRLPNATGPMIPVMNEDATSVPNLTSGQIAFNNWIAQHHGGVKPGSSTTPSAVASAATPPVNFGGYMPYDYGANQYGGMHATGLMGSHATDPGFLPKLMSMGKKAWGLYKKMWEDNPGMAMWTTTNVVRTIAALLNTSEAEERERSRYVAGFKPGGWDEVRERYGGRIPGTTGAMASNKPRPSAGLNTGRKPIEGVRTSAIDNRPPGLLGSRPQRALG